MHRCLIIEEILNVVFEFAEYFPRLPRVGTAANRELSQEYQVDLRTLFYLALTCKTFQNPALDRLWRKQWGLENLVALLPKGQKGLKTATDEDWAHFDTYARRVKRLDVSDDGTCLTTPPSLPSRAVMETLCARPKPILPSLKDIFWNSSGVSDKLLGYFDIFLGPLVTRFLLATADELIQDFRALEMPDDDVESLEMSDDDGRVDSESLVSKAEMKLVNLSSMSPMLEDFCFMTQGTPQLMTQLPQIVSSLPELREFCCTVVNLPFPFELLSASSVHPSLKLLKLCVNSEDDQYPIIERDASATVGVQVTFSTLQYLELGGASSFFCAEVLEGIKLPALKAIKLQVDEATGLRDALVAINTSCSPRALRTLEVVDFPAGDPRGDGIVVTGNDLRILRKFRFLTSLNIYCPFDLTDRDLKNIATWWPCLQTLSMGKYGWRIAPRVTLVGLLELVKGCPRIYQLDVAFNPMQPGAGVDPQGHRNKRLTALGVCDSPVEGDHQDIANRLKAIFPRLSTINIPASRPSCEAWYQVQLNL